MTLEFKPGSIDEIVIHEKQKMYYNLTYNFIP
jgi:hypothetical protein